MKRKKLEWLLSISFSKAEKNVNQNKVSKAKQKLKVKNGQQESNMIKCVA